MHKVSPFANNTCNVSCIQVVRGIMVAKVLGRNDIFRLRYTEMDI